MEKYLSVRESSDVLTTGTLVAASDFTQQQKAPESETDIKIEAEEVGPSKAIQQDSVSADPWPYLKEFLTFVKINNFF